MAPLVELLKGHDEALQLEAAMSLGNIASGTAEVTEAAIEAVIEVAWVGQVDLLKINQVQEVEGKLINEN